MSKSLPFNFTEDLAIDRTLSSLLQHENSESQIWLESMRIDFVVDPRLVMGGKYTGAYRNESLENVLKENLIVV